MHKPLFQLSQLGRRGFLGLAGVAALADSLLSRKRVVSGITCEGYSGAEHRVERQLLPRTAAP